EVLRACWDDPDRLRPDRVAARVTEQAAAEFARLAAGLQARAGNPQAAAHFLMRLLFCLFAEDIGLLPKDLFTRLVANTRTRPDHFTRSLGALFAAMAAPDGFFGEYPIKWFNGGLFDE